MANVIDSLLVTLGLDPSGFKKGAQEAEKATDSLSKKTEDGAKKVSEVDKKLTDAQTARAKLLNEQSKKTLDGFSKARNELLLFLSLFTAGKGMMDFASSTITNVANLERLGEVVGMGVNDLAAWQLAAKNTGGSAEEMAGQILKASQDVAGFHNGIASQSISGFLALGGETSELKNSQTYLMGMSRVVHEMVKKYGEAQAFQFANQRMGMGLNEFNLLKLGTAELQKQLILDAKITGLDDKKGQQAVEMQKRWNNLAESFSQTGRTILFALTPALEELSFHLNRVAQWAIDHKDTIKGWVDDTVTAVRKFVGAADDAAQSVGGWKIVFEALIGLKVVGVFFRLASAIGKVGTALAAVAQYAPLLRLLSSIGAGLEIIFHSDNLNKGEDEIVKKIIENGRAAEKPTLENKDDVPRGIKNNNPGNIRYGEFAISQGATGKDRDGFAIFDSMYEGKNADIALLNQYLDKKFDTIRKVISKYAPASENDTMAYISDVSKQTGISPDATLTARNLGAVSQAIFAHENGAKYDNSYNSTNSAETNIGHITINTQAKDANSIAGGLRDALSTQNLAWQINTGVQ